MSQALCLPVTDDVDTGGFFRAAERGELAIARCRDCGTIIHLPMGICNKCYRTDIEWIAVPARGKVHSFTVTHRQLHPAFPAPYTIILIELYDSQEIRFVGHLDGVPDLQIGAAVEGYFERVEDISLLRWRLARDG